MRTHIPKAIREAIKNRYGGRCGYCGEESKLQIDHIIPVESIHMHKDVGLNSPENLMPACFSCNNYKNTHSLEQFRRELGSQVERGRKHSLNFRLAEKFGLIRIQPKHPVVFYFESLEVKP